MLMSDTLNDKISRAVELSRLSMSEGEKEELIKDVMDILESFSLLSEVSEEEMAFHPVIIQNIYRRDEPKRFEDVDAILSLAETHQRFVKGPRVL